MTARRSYASLPEPRPVSTLAGALWDEYDAIHGDPRPAVIAQGADASLRAYYDAALQHDQAALCLSGGGIRSAAFALGVFQALAQNKLLTQFHYFSTVSGGGYIGGWLTALLHANGGDAAKVQEQLGDQQASPELRTLRGYTNFLAPHPGIASPDTWAGIMLWVRNVLINWMIFLPALFALALVPGFYADLLRRIGIDWSWPLLLVALLSLGVGVYTGAEHLPSHAYPDAESQGRRAIFVPLRVVAPLMAWAVLVPLVAAPWLRPVMRHNAVLGDLIPWLGFAVTEAAYVIATLRATGRDREMFWCNFGWWTLAALFGTAVLWVELDLAIGVDPRVIAVLGPLAVTLAHLALSLIYVALRTEAFRGDMDREWLARLNAEKVVPALLWAIFAAVCLLLPPLVLDNWSTKFYPFLVSAFGLATGPVAAFLGKISAAEPSGTSASTGAGSRFVLSFRVVLNLIAAVFATTLFLLLARAGAKLSGGRVVGDLVLLGFTGWLAWWLGRHINVNRFSMHAVYRNRLVRAFLGTARRTRRPDGFTGMDPYDNPRMTNLSAHDGKKRTLFPVINVTLNLTAGSNSAWAERKGESFTVTPCASGAAYLHRQEDVAAGLPARGAYVRTADYAGAERETGRNDPGNGLTLGTALALSGAAASPNMGYDSSPATAFLMTLFNVRLGAWLPNPALASTEQLRRAKPPNALLTLARELMGLSNDQGGAVYLSDGGHFEILGIYEMVRRRCRRIVVIDADADQNATFEGLGNAVRKIRIDLDIDIVFSPPVHIGSRTAPLTPFHWFAYGTIRYPDSTTPGELIYLKPSDLPDMPMDVRAYRNAHSDFPHDPTANQFYGESQFESYRQLGQSETQELTGTATSLAEVFTSARQQLDPVPDLPTAKELDVT